MVTATSDDFFDLQAEDLLDVPIDLCFIDGMHLLRVRAARLDAGGAPRRPGGAGGDRRHLSQPPAPGRCGSGPTRVWTGDVWKLHACLAALRPDLFLFPLDTRPTGLLLIAGLDPGNRVLWERYNPVVKQYRDRVAAEPPPEVIARQGALAPDDPLVVGPAGPAAAPA